MKIPARMAGEAIDARTRYSELKLDLIAARKSKTPASKFNQSLFARTKPGPFMRPLAYTGNNFATQTFFWDNAGTLIYGFVFRRGIIKKVSYCISGLKNRQFLSTNQLVCYTLAEDNRAIRRQDSTGRLRFLPCMQGFNCYFFVTPEQTGNSRKMAVLFLIKESREDRKGKEAKRDFSGKGVYLLTKKEERLFPAALTSFITGLSLPAGRSAAIAC